MASDARAILTEARKAAMDVESARRQLEARLSPALARIAERRNSLLEARIGRDERKVQEACDLLYGDAGAYLDDAERDILYQRYVLHKTWDGVARAVAYSPRQCQYKHNEAMGKIRP